MQPDDDKDNKIATLEAKVKALQNQITQRVRSFLLQGKSGLNNRQQSGTPFRTQSKGVQTENSSKSSQSRLLNLEFTPQPSTPGGQEAELQSQNTNKISENIPPINERLFNSLYNERMQLHQQLSKILQSQKSTSTGQNHSQQDVSAFQQSEDATKPQKKEFKRLRRQIRLLRQKLAFESEVSVHAREGLLISEQENYQFRLTIAALLEQKKVFQEKEKTIENQGDQKEKLKQELRKLEQKNQQLNYKVSKLKQQLVAKEEDLASYIKLVQKAPSAEQSQELIFQVQELKDQVFAISNYVPITDQEGSPQQNQAFFRPENIKEILSILRRVQAYCRNLNVVQDQRQREVAEQKQMFVRVLKKLVFSTSPVQRDSMRRMVQSDGAYRRYTRIFEPDRDKLEDRVGSCLY